MEDPPDYPSEPGIAEILGASLVAQRLKHLPPRRETRVRSLGWEDLLEKEMVTHSSKKTKANKIRYHLYVESKIWHKLSESEVAQLCLTLCNSMDCSLPGFSVHVIFQARILE